MISLDGVDLFGSGPCSIRPQSWQRNALRRAFAGVDGELVLDLGLRPRQIVQQGRLQATTAAELVQQIERIEAMLDGQTHTLLDHHGRTFAPVQVEHFEPTTPLQAGRGFWCDYTLQYRQLP